MATSSSSGNPAGFIIGAINEGKSATAALDEYRSAGGQIRTDRWYRLVGEISADVANRGAIAQLSGAQLVPSELHTPWSAGDPGRYAYQARVFLNRQVTLPDGTVSQFVDFEHAMVTSSAPLTVQQIKDAAVDQVTEGLKVGSLAGSVIDAVPTGAYRMEGIE